ncbi:MAG: methyltransferase domain-containing protein [Rhodobacteraceae bacterium]|nr:methyltransferase domain-containing protein [Paracoccaceae bacterium]
MPSAGLPARAAALSLISGVTDHGRLLPEMLPKAVEHLPDADRARAQRLASDTLRWMDRADRALGPYLRSRPTDRALNILRLGAVELAHDPGGAHGIVSDAVDLANASAETKRQSGLVNAVLRKIAQAGPAGWAGLPVPRLPKWLRKPLLADYGRAVVEGFEAAHAAGAPLDLTPKDGDAAGLAARLDGAALPGGSVRVSARSQVSALVGYDAGEWWVQDAAAAFPARVLAAQPGEAVLDLCAAPGGKTMQLAATSAAVTAVDSSEKRLARVRENLARTGLVADMVVADALDWQTEARFDAILLDAPCSATGTIRRHPDLPCAKTGEDFPELFKLQLALIDRALAWLKPGGRLVYCTCSLLFDEGEEQLKDALERHPDLRVDRAALAIPGLDPAWIDAAGGARLRPDFMAESGGMDGFYMVCLRRGAAE